jgi:hypothetical protein
MFLEENFKNLLIIFPHPPVGPNIETHIIYGSFNKLSTALFNICHLKENIRSGFHWLA